AVNLAITPSALMQGKKVIARLENGHFPETFYEAGEIPELRAFLESEYGERLAALREADEAGEGEDDKEAAGEDEEDDDEASGDIILLQADQNLDYQTLYLVMRTARLAGFRKYRLAIMKK
ncbi:MAG: hypothetical protein D6729_10865, partial [Deltaproteobacteria bacterium]